MKLYKLIETTTQKRNYMNVRTHVYAHTRVGFCLEPIWVKNVQNYSIKAWFSCSHATDLNHSCSCMFWRFSEIYYSLKCYKLYKKVFGSIA